MAPSRSLPALLALVLATGCGASDSTPSDTASPDVPPDALPDSLTDTASPDVPPDASPDSLPGDSASLDAGPDEEATPPVYPLDDTLRLNHLQAKGTHNSYHMWPPEGVFLQDFAYEMPPLPDQLELSGIRQFELDIHYDPADGLQVYHAPVIDANTTCLTLGECLSQIFDWSQANPGHHAVFVFIEPKDDVDPIKLTDKYDLMDETILSAWPRERLLAPDDVRGSAATLKAAILDTGWPTLGQTRDKLAVVMLDTGIHRTNYLAEHPNLEGRIMFVLSSGEEDFSSVIKIDDPESGSAEIQKRVQQGFIVRTRSDEMPQVAQFARMKTALDSGAHFLSTNYPAPVPDFEFVLDLPGGTPSRCNPLTAPPECTSPDIEALPGR
jgi:hypothetical protein